MAFADIVAKLTEGVENIGDVAEFSKQLQAEHEKELSIRDAKIQTITGELDTHQKQVVALKATNYDLLMATGVNGGEGDKPESKPEPVRDVNSLFQPKEG